MISIMGANVLSNNQNLLYSDYAMNLNAKSIFHRPISPLAAGALYRVDRLAAACARTPSHGAVLAPGARSAGNDTASY
jgi:hypothetical protein